MSRRASLASDSLERFRIRDSWNIRIAAIPAAPARTHSVAVFFVHAPDRNHRNAYGAANLGQPRDTLRRSERSLRRRVENGPKKDVTRSRIFRLARFLHAVAGNADQKFRRGVSCPEPANYFARRQRTRLPNARLPRPPPAPHRADRLQSPDARLAITRNPIAAFVRAKKFARGHIPFADLHPINASRRWPREFLRASFQLDRRRRALSCR